MKVFIVKKNITNDSFSIVGIAKNYEKAIDIMKKDDVIEDGFKCMLAMKYGGLLFYTFKTKSSFPIYYEIIESVVE